MEEKFTLNLGRIIFSSIFCTGLSSLFVLSLSIMDLTKFNCVRYFWATPSHYSPSLSFMPFDIYTL